MKIKISTQGVGKPFIKQLQSFKSEWGNCTFHINEEIEECDFFIVYGGLLRNESVLCPKENTILITNEPPSVKDYKKEFTDQFGTVITCNRNIKHKNVVYSQQALPWWVGHKITPQSNETHTYSKTYNELKSIQLPTKTKVISVVASNKQFTRGHRKRYKLALKLKEYFGDSIDVFGIGTNQVEDKWDAIAPYKYSIVIENTVYKDYWSEKLSDAFLGFSYPIYLGCPNIEKYFSPKSLSLINDLSFKQITKIIERLIQNNTYEKSIEEIEKARLLILDHYQLFPMLVEFCNTHHKPNTEKEHITIIPESDKITIWEYLRTLGRRIRNKLLL